VHGQYWMGCGRISILALQYTGPPTGPYLALAEFAPNLYSYLHLPSQCLPAVVASSQGSAAG